MRVSGPDNQARSAKRIPKLDAEGLVLSWGKFVVDTWPVIVRPCTGVSRDREDFVTHISVRGDYRNRQKHAPNFLCLRQLGGNDDPRLATQRRLFQLALQEVTPSRHPKPRPLAPPFLVPGLRPSPTPRQSRTSEPRRVPLSHSRPCFFSLAEQPPSSGECGRQGGAPGSHLLSYS